MTQSTASIFTDYLVAQGKGNAPDTLGTDWQVFTNFMPDGGTSPDQCLATYDTSGVKDGRLPSGQTVLHPGVQILVRGRVFADVWAKAEEIVSLFDSLGYGTVIGSDTIHNASLVGTPLSLGVENRGTRRRFLVSVNYLATIGE